MFFKDCGNVTGKSHLVEQMAIERGLSLSAIHLSPSQEEKVSFGLSRKCWVKSQEVISQVLNSEAERTAVVFLGEANKALEPFLIKKVIHVSFVMGVLSLKWGSSEMYSTGVLRYSKRPKSPPTRGWSSHQFPVMKVLWEVLKELSSYNNSEDGAVLHALNGLPLN